MNVEAGQQLLQYRLIMVQSGENEVSRDRFTVAVDWFPEAAGSNGGAR